MSKKRIVAFLIITVIMATIMPLNVVNAGVSDNEIIRETITVYHTKVQGTLSIDGDNKYTKEYSSGDDYLDGNYSDDEIATIINDYKNDMNTVASNYNVTVVFEEGITGYYYDVHDEIKQNSTNQIVIVTVLDKYQIYTIKGTRTPAVTLAKVSGIKVKNVAKKKAVVTWKKVANADGYKVEMSKKKAKGYKVVKTLKGAKFTKKSLKKGKIYYFRVRAYKIVSGKTIYGKYSAIKKVKIKK